jgi:hypothetical protein
MSASLNEACMAGNVDEVMMRLNLGEDVNQVILATAEDPGSNPARVYVCKVFWGKYCNAIHLIMN